MEDSKKQEAQSKKDRRVVELTPAMELHSERPMKIVDLTNALQEKPALPRRDLPPELPAAKETPAAPETPTEPDVIAPASVEEPVPETPSVSGPPDLMAPPREPETLDRAQPPEQDIAVELDQAVAPEDTLQTPIIELGADQPADRLPPEDVADLLSTPSEPLSPPAPEPPLESESAPEAEAATESSDPMEAEPAEPVPSILEMDLPAEETLDLTDVITPVDLMPAEQIADDTSAVDEMLEEPELALAPDTFEDEPAGEESADQAAPPADEDGSGLDVGDTVVLTDVITPVDLMPAQEIDADLPVEDDIAAESLSAEDHSEAAPDAQIDALSDAPDDTQIDLTDIALPAEESAGDDQSVEDLLDEPELDFEATGPESALDGPVLDVAPEESPPPNQIDQIDQMDPLDEADAIELTDMTEPAAEALGTEADEDDIDIDILELTDTAEPAVLGEAPVAPDADEDDTLELIDIAEPALPVAESEAPDGDDGSADALELTDIAAPVEEAEALEADEDDTLELTDIADPVAAAPDMADMDEDDTIELTDIVDPAEMAAELALAGIHVPPGTDDEDVTLTDQVDTEQVTAAFEQMAAGTPAGDDAKDADEEDTIELIDVIDAAQLVETAAPSGDAIKEPAADLDADVGTPDDSAAESDLLSDDELALGLDDALEEEPALEDEEEPVPAAADDDLMASDGLENDDLVMGLGDALDEGIFDPDAVEDENMVLSLDESFDGEQSVQTVADGDPDLGMDDELVDGIDLDALDVVDESSAHRSDEVADEPAPATEADSADEQVIRLDSVLRHVRENKEKIVEDLTQSVEAELGKADSDTGLGAIGMALDEVKDAVGESVSLDEKEIEKVIEQVIRTRYHDTIEQYIAATVERVVTREMESIKYSLMQDHGEEE